MSDARRAASRAAQPRSGAASRQTSVTPSLGEGAGGRVPLLETYRGTVYPWHCDHMSHMNVMWYVGKFDEATWNLMSRLGMNAAFLREHHRGMVAVDQRLSYQRELHAGDTVAVSTGIVSVAAKKLIFVHEMRNADTGEIAAVTLLTGVHIDTRTRKSCTLPEAARAKASELVAPHALPWPA